MLLRVCAASLFILFSVVSSVPVHQEKAGAVVNAALPSMTAEAAADLITTLPGLPEGVNFRMFSGYVHVDGRKSLFYWYVESMRSPTNDPLVLWTNGGPGCSSFEGFFSEQGPFRPNKRGALDLNPYAWNKIANMIFLEQPAGVGFSIAEGNITYNDAAAALDNYRFILGFLDRFPERRPNQFFISGESYAGHYLPTLAMQIVKSGGINFKGLAVGNPLTYMPYRDYGQYATYANHQLIPKPLWDSYLRSGCAMVEEDDRRGAATPEDLRVRKETCASITDQMDRLTEDMNPYALDFPVCSKRSLAAGREERHALLRKIRSTRRMHTSQVQADDQGVPTATAGEAAAGAGGTIRSGPGGGYFPRYVPCTDNYIQAYLNRPDVQDAIHASRTTTWAVCNDTINTLYSNEDVVAPMMPVYKDLLASVAGDGGPVRILIFSGDDDSICATAGAQMWIWTLGPAVVEPWHPWYTHGQVSGFTVGFDGFRFATVHGAGHMVPSTRPAQALDLFERFLAGVWDGDRPPHAVAAAAAGFSSGFDGAAAVAE